MNPITKEWISKAEGDWNAAGILFRSRKHPNYDAAFFHAQECAHKYLKARLQEAGVAYGKPPRDGLSSLALSIDPGWSLLRQDLIFLIDCVVDYRYPGNSATRPEAKEAIRRCRNVRRVARQAFGLKR